MPLSRRLSAFTFVAFALALACSSVAADMAPQPIELRTAFPAPNAAEVCLDTPLRLVFATPPSLGPAGKITIRDATDDHIVETIDVSAPTAVKTIGGLPNYKYYPVIIDGTTATVFPKNGALAYGKTYYVTVDAGVFNDSAGAFAAVAPTAWRFTTKARPPAARTTRLVVAADGAGDFCTVQGAVDFVPAGNTTPTTIFIRKGRYTEMVFFTNKHALTFLGEDRKETILSYATNDRFNPSSGNPFAGNNPNPSAESPASGANIYHRGVFLAHRVDDLVLANLTIRNTTPSGGSQAEAIILNGTTTAHAILKDLDLYSFQDTLQVNGQAYIAGSYIEGDVDFMWGTGPCFFENCTARSVRSGTYYTQIRNPPTNHGYVYVHCTFDGAPGVTDNFISRVQPARFPASEVVLIDCTLTAAVGPIGWQHQTTANVGTGDTSRLHFWEFNSHTPDGKPVDTSGRLAGSRQLKPPSDAELIANYRSPAFVLGHDWNPRAAPVFQAAGQAK